MNEINSARLLQEESTFLELLNAFPCTEHKRKDVVVGTVVRIDKDGAWIDLGAKTEGIVCPEKATKLVLHQKGNFRIVGTPGDEGYYLLSPSTCAPHSYEEAWASAWKAQNTYIEVTVLRLTTAKNQTWVTGAKTDTPWGLEAYVRLSQLNTQGKTLDDLPGSKIWVKVITVDQLNNDLIVSQQALIREHHQYLLSNPDQVTSGVVTGLQDFGAFFDIGYGVIGMLSSRLRSSKLEHYLEIGQRLDLVVSSTNNDRFKLKLNEELTLSAYGRQCWDAAQALQKSGETREVTIYSLVPPQPGAKLIGVNAMLCGVRGLIPMGETPYAADPTALLKQEVTVKVLRADPEDDRLILSCLVNRRLLP